MGGNLLNTKPRNAKVLYKNAWDASTNDVSSAVPTTVSTLTFTEYIGNSYVVFGTISQLINSITQDAMFDLYDGTNVVQEYYCESASTSNQSSYVCIYPYTATATGERTFTLRHNRETTLATVTSRDIMLNVLELHPRDNYSWEPGSTSTTEIQPTYTTKTSLTAPTTEDYIVLGCAGYECTTLAQPFVSVSVTNQARRSAYVLHMKDTLNLQNWVFGRKISLVADDVVAIQFSNGVAATTRTQQCSLVLMKASNFANVYYAESTTATSTTSLTYVAKLSSNFTIANPGNAHLLLASIAVRNENVSYATEVLLTNTSTTTDYGYKGYNVPVSTTGKYKIHSIARTISFTQETNDIEWQYLTSNAAGPAWVRDATILLIDLGIPM